MRKILCAITLALFMAMVVAPMPAIAENIEAKSWGEVKSLYRGGDGEDPPTDPPPPPPPPPGSIMIIRLIVALMT